MQQIGMKDVKARACAFVASCALVSVLAPSVAMAQQAPAQAPETWVGTAGAGVSLTSGNTDTTMYNIAFDVTRDPKTRNVQKAHGLFLRGEQNDIPTADRLSLGFQNRFAMSPRAFAFGQVEYLRDTFKLIDYLVAPTAGIGFKVIDTTSTKFSVDGGVGVVMEKNPGVEVKTDAAVTAGEAFSRQLTATTSFKHAATALWRADQFADGLYTISAGVGVQVAKYLQLTIDVLDTYQNRPPTAATKKNDVAFVTALAAKF